MKNLFKVLIAVAAITGVASVYAVPTLTMTASTGGSVTVTDGGGGDACPAPGCVTFIGAVGVWKLNVDTGLTKPALRPPPQMDLSYLASTGGTSTPTHLASTMTIDWSDSGFNGNFFATDLLGGTQTAGMTTTDHIFINGVLVFTLGPFTATAFSSSTSGFITLHPTDVLTLEMVISKPTSTGSSTFTATGNKNFTAVPDGGSAVALLGIALVGVETLRRKLKAA